MTAPFAGELLGWRLNGKGRLVPNSADSSSKVSRLIAGRVLDLLGVPSDVASGVQDAASGRPLEHAVASALGEQLSELTDPEREFQVHDEPRLVTEFVQYAHLRRVDELASNSAELRLALGTDYLIRPDVVVSLPGRDDSLPFLHAVISCKWTIRSDRVQNIRHEYNLLVRHRRERLPHLVTVTAEPLPTRLASIVRGTGEVDATYHIAFDAMGQAISELQSERRLTRDQLEAWDEAVGQGRLRSFADLAPTLASW